LDRSTALERALRQDRLLILAGVGGVVLLAWAYLLAGAGLDMSMAGMAMEPVAWTPFYAWLIFAMWWIMMIAMMLPSAAPTALLFAAIKRQQESAAPQSGTGIFIAGNLAVWGLFSLVATLAQWGLEQSGLISIGMAGGSPVLAGIILLSAGLYQLTPFKIACLRHCQSPVLFLSTHWSPGMAGAFRMGLVHGAYCLGCCWFLMALLFVGGVMNPVWIAGIAVYVALEKMLAVGPWLSRITGATLASAGAFVLLVLR
jgi:predicted metal-binding membrane protein